MKIVGSSKQDGIPSPDNPVEIKNETILIITDKEGNKKEMPFNYEKILKEGDKIEKINGKWYLIRRKLMNDIEILEELRHELGLYANVEKVRQGQAIENLIQRNKNLEQIEKEHKEENGRLRDKIKELEKVILLDSKPIILGMIPISRIKEKIEELTKIKGDLATYIATSERIKVLQELLEESDK